jgi:hypothetical protein
MLLAACHLSLAADGDGGEAGWTSLFNGKNFRWLDRQVPTG